MAVWQKKVSSLRIMLVLFNSWPSTCWKLITTTNRFATNLPLEPHQLFNNWMKNFGIHFLYNLPSTRGLRSADRKVKRKHLHCQERRVPLHTPVSLGCCAAECHPWSSLAWQGPGQSTERSEKFSSSGLPWPSQSHVRAPQLRHSSWREDQKLPLVSPDYQLVLQGCGEWD